MEVLDKIGVPVFLHKPIIRVLIYVIQMSPCYQMFPSVFFQETGAQSWHLVEFSPFKKYRNVCWKNLFHGSIFVISMDWFSYLIFHNAGTWMSVKYIEHLFIYVYRYIIIILLLFSCLSVSAIYWVQLYIFEFEFWKIYIKRK